MKAIQMREPGGPETLGLVNVPPPRIDPGELLVAVELAGVNFADVNARRATYADRGERFRPGLGLEVYGHIAAAGSAVTNFQVGDRVAGFSRSPGYAEFAACDERLLWRVPDDVPDLQAAAFPMIGQTAFHLLHSAARLQPGESVLVTAAAGGVGTTAIQVARRLGAGLITGAAGSAERAERARALGADAVIDYSAVPIADGLEKATGTRAVDVALDAVGGAVRAQLFECLALFGRLIEYGNSCGETEKLPDGKQLREHLVSIGGVRMAKVRGQAPELLRSSGDQLLAWLAQGSMQMQVSGVLQLSDAAEAHRRLEARQVVGKLLLKAQ